MKRIMCLTDHEALVCIRLPAGGWSARWSERSGLGGRLKKMVGALRRRRAVSLR